MDSINNSSSCDSTCNAFFDDSLSRCESLRSGSVDFSVSPRSSEEEEVGIYRTSRGGIEDIGTDQVFDCDAHEPQVWRSVDISSSCGASTYGGSISRAAAFGKSEGIFFDGDEAEFDFHDSFGEETLSMRKVSLKSTKMEAPPISIAPRKKPNFSQCQAKRLPAWPYFVHPSHFYPRDGMSLTSLLSGLWSALEESAVDFNFEGQNSVFKCRAYVSYRVVAFEVQVFDGEEENATASDLLVEISHRSGNSSDFHTMYTSELGKKLSCLAHKGTRVCSQCNGGQKKFVARSMVPPPLSFEALDSGEDIPVDLKPAMCLTSSPFFRVQIQGLGILATMCDSKASRCTQVRRRILSDEILPTVVSLFSSPIADVQRMAIAVIANCLPDIETAVENRVLKEVGDRAADVVNAILSENHQLKREALRLALRLGNEGAFLENYVHDTDAVHRIREHFVEKTDVFDQGIVDSFQVFNHMVQLASVC